MRQALMTAVKPCSSGITVRKLYRAPGGWIAVRASPTSTRHDSGAPDAACARRSVHEMPDPPEALRTSLATRRRRTVASHGLSHRLRSTREPSVGAEVVEA